MGNSSSLRHHLDTAEKTGVLQLSKSNLRELPKDISQISHLLRTLDLSFNRLQIVGDNYGSFKSLKVLNLSNNKIKIISNSIGQLVKLESLQLENNLLESLPDDLAKLNALKTINLANNKFEQFPKQVCILKKMELLNLANNEIEYLPDEIGICNASEINLNNNKLANLNNNLGNCPELKILRLDNNKLPITALTKPILGDSKICLLSLENNQFTLKQLQERDGYEQYIERYTSTKRKMI